VGARWNVDFIMMICLSTAIASLGLIQNSTAVVIGAMVVAPLMTPLIGSGLALVQGNTSLFRDSLKAMGFGIGAAFIYRRLGIQGTRLGVKSPLWMRRTVLILILITVLLTAPLGFKLAQQLREGQTRPYTLPVSQSVYRAINKRIHQEYGVTLISALRFAIKSDTDAAIILSAQKPVSVDLVSDLKQLVNDEMGENVRVAVHVLKEVKVKRGLF
jgi:uncharacterized membrane protein